MKKISILLALVLTLGLVACGKGKEKPEEPVTPVEEVEAVKEDEVVEVEDEDAGAGIIPFEEPLVVMGAAQYRGTVMSINDETEKTITLEQYKGTNFGAKEIVVTITENTRGNFDLELIEMGQYLEVYYGRDLNSVNQPVAVDGIAINYLGVAEERNFNAIVVSRNVSEENPNEGSILVTDLDGENETLFNYNNDGSSQLYLNIEEVTVGTRLNIFHKPMMTMSLPPQIFAEEIRLYVIGEEENIELVEETKEEEQLQGETADAISPELEKVV